MKYFLFLLLMTFAGGVSIATELKNNNERPIVVRVIDATKCDLSHFTKDITPFEYGEAIMVLKQMPPKYGIVVGHLGDTLQLKSEKNKHPLPLKVKFEMDRWFLVITFILTDQGKVEARTIRFDSSKGGDFLIKFKNQSFAVFCNFGD